MRRRLDFSLYAIAACLLVLTGAVTPVHAGPFSSLVGSWSGAGRIKLQGGQTEKIRCRGYYTSKGPSDLGIAIRCASSSNKVEMRAKLIYSSGSISGSWEERTFNASGDVTGRSNPGSIKLSINGAISGSMSVSHSGVSQRVLISTPGSVLQSVSIKMKKRG